MIGGGRGAWMSSSRTQVHALVDSRALACLLGVIDQVPGGTRCIFNLHHYPKHISLHRVIDKRLPLTNSNTQIKNITHSYSRNLYL